VKRARQNQNMERKQRLWDKEEEGNGTSIEKNERKKKREIKEAMMLRTHLQVTLVNKRSIRRWKVENNARIPGQKLQHLLQL
jgi:hypothetical protein